MPKFHVLVPIAGHASLTVQAEDKQEAINMAMSQVTDDDLEEWEALPMFNQGNVCHCPSPWEAEAELADDEDEDEDG